MAKAEKAPERPALTRHRGGPAISPLEEVERAVERFFPRGWPRPWRGEWPSWGELMPLLGRTPRVDVVDRENEVVVRAEVPGVNKEDLDVSVSDSSVTIRGEVKPTEEEKGEYYFREIGYGAFSRTIDLPAAVDTKKAKVRLKNGILEMMVPKLETARRHKIAIEEA
jgi:HSP20 family protein